MDFHEKLKEYFQNTPKEQILADWESTAESDEAGFPVTVTQFLEDFAVTNVMKAFLPIIDNMEQTDRYKDWLAAALFSKLQSLQKKGNLVEELLKKL